jgi:hypothetical protein
MEKLKIYQTDPWMMDYFVDDQISYTYSYGSNVETLMKCPRCGYEKIRKIRRLHDKGFACPRCGDGISYPNKFMFNILEQLKLPFLYEVSKTQYGFEWITGLYRYDFYFQNSLGNYFIEMDGHYHSNSIEMQESDKIKDRLALKHNINVIRICCDYDQVQNRFEFIRTNILQSKLPQILQFSESDIDWDKCDLYANSSLMIKACELWSRGMRNTLDISNKLHISRMTASIYLRRGAVFGLCDYNPKEESQRVLLKGRTLDSERKKCKPVAVYNTLGMIAVFEGAVRLSEASEGLFGVHISRPMITNVCNGNCGTNYGLHFQLISKEQYDEYRKFFGGHTNPKLFNPSIKYSSREKPVAVFLQEELVDIFSGRAEAANVLTNRYGVVFSQNSITNVCLKRQKQYNGFTFQNSTREEYEQYKMIANKEKV